MHLDYAIDKRSGLSFIIAVFRPQKRKWCIKMIGLVDCLTQQILMVGPTGY